MITFQVLPFTYAGECQRDDYGIDPQISTADDLGLPPPPLTPESEQDFAGLVMRAYRRTNLTDPEDPNDTISSL